VPACRVLQSIPNRIFAFLPQHLHKARDAIPLYLFECPQVSEIRTGALSFPRLPMMITRVGVGGVGRDDVADPAEQATRADPQARGDDEPQDTGQEATIIELSLSLARPCPTLVRTLADQDIFIIGLQTYFGWDKYT
jgi:hypothetical protein